MLFKCRECRIAACGECPVKCFAINARRDRYPADLVCFRYVAQSQHKHVLGLFRRSVKIGGNVLWVSEAFIQSDFVWP